MEPGDIAGKILTELKESLRVAQEEQAEIRQLEDRIARLMTRTALEEFPALKQMSAEQIQQFGDVVNRASSDFSVRAANLAHTAEQE